MADLRAITERLRSMEHHRPTPERRAEVIESLSNKWEGVQAVAVHVLAAWGDRDCVEALHRYLIHCLDRRYGWAVRGVVVRALHPLVTEQDVDWVLDLYFGVQGGFLKHELLWLVTGLPPSAARTRLVAGLQDTDPSNRRAAIKAIGNMAFPDRRTLLQQLRNDPDDAVRASARLLSEAG